MAYATGQEPGLRPCHSISDGLPSSLGYLPYYSVALSCKDLGSMPQPVLLAHRQYLRLGHLHPMSPVWPVSSAAEPGLTPTRRDCQLCLYNILHDIMLLILQTHCLGTTTMPGPIRYLYQGTDRRHALSTVYYGGASAYCLTVLRAP
jgi:hypothetical protein